jgi:hypothetical protein
LAGNALGIFLAVQATVRHGPDGQMPLKGLGAEVNRPAPIDSTYVDSTYGEGPWAPIHSTYGEAP